MYWFLCNCILKGFFISVMFLMASDIKLKSAICHCNHTQLVVIIIIATSERERENLLCQGASLECVRSYIWIYFSAFSVCLFFSFCCFFLPPPFSLSLSPSLSLSSCEFYNSMLCVLLEWWGVCASLCCHSSQATE